MATMKKLTGLVSDVIVPIQKEDVERSSGLALDIGSTIGKIIYRSNKEYKNGKPIKPQEGKMGQIHFAMFPRSDVSGMVEYIKENCDLTPDAEGKILVNSSGVGGAAFKKEIEGGLNCKMEIISEFDCFCKALLALEKILPEKELFTPQSEEVIKAQKAMNEQFKVAMEKAQSMSEGKFKVELKKEIKDEDRPRIMLMAGSGSGLMQIKKDGTFSLLGGVYTAGRFLYGLSATLTGENDFKKLEQMASESDGRTVDIFWSDLKPKSEPGEENMYDMDMADMDMHLFPFGKGVTVPASEMKKGDMVWSVFNAVASVHACSIAAYVLATKAKKVYICGNVFNTQLMRDLLMKTVNQLSFMLPEEDKYECLFLKNGGMYGAMGAYLHVKEPTSDTTHL